MHLKRRVTMSALIAVMALILVPVPLVRASSTVSSLSPTWTFSTGVTTARSPYWGAQPYAGAAVGDLFGNGTEDIVVGFPNGQLYAFNALTHALLPGWPKQLGGAIDTTPTLADLYGDGRREVIATAQDGHIYAYDGNGNSLAGWPQTAWYGPSIASNFTSYFIGGAAVGDLFGTGQQDIVAAAADHFVYAWDSQGHLLPGFPVNMWDTSVATPALVDLDNNGRLWIIAGGDSVPKMGRTGAWYAIPPTGCAHPNDTLSGCDHAGWPRYQNEVPWSSPAGGDLQGTGQQLVVTGTGHDYAQTGCPSCGRYVQVAMPSGAELSGWPQATPSQVFGSPAVGDLGHGGLDVVDQTEAPALTAFDWGYQGGVHWSAANTGANSDGTPATLTDLGSPAIAPVNGAQNGVWTPGNGRIFGWAASGVLTAEIPINGVSFATPTVSDLGDGRLSLVETLYNGNTSSPTYSMVVTPLPGTSANGIPVNSWPTFHGNNQHSGGIVPIATMPAGTTVSSSEDNIITWNAAAGATGYHLWVHTASLGWALYTTTTSTSIKFTGSPSTSYDFFVDAFNALGSADLHKVTEHTLQISAGAVNHGPVATGHGLYTLDAFGQVGSGDSPLTSPASPMWPNWKIARSLALAPGTNPVSGLVLDGFGGLHAVGTTPLTVPGNAGYWPNWDIARDLVITSTAGGQYSGYVLDGFGGVHSFGSAPAVTTTGYWPNWDIAAKLTVIPGTAVNHVSGYVMDGFGGLHPFGTPGDLRTVPTDGAYWPNWTIARAVVACSAASGGGGYVLDGFGGIHPFGGRAQPQWAGYWPNWDIARSITVDPTDSTCSRGWMVDGFGGIHPWGSWSPGLAAGQTDFPLYLPNQDVFRAIAAV